MLEPTLRPSNLSLTQWVARITGRDIHSGLVYASISGRSARPAPRIPRLRTRQGRCHELSYRGQQQAQEAGERWILVQGLVDLRVGVPMVHSWLQHEDLVYDPVVDLLYPTSLSYRKAHNAIECDSLDAEQACKLALETGSTGPWWGHIPAERLPTREQLGPWTLDEFRDQACLPPL